MTEVRFGEASRRRGHAGEKEGAMHGMKGHKASRACVLSSARSYVQCRCAGLGCQGVAGASGCNLPFAWIWVFAQLQRRKGSLQTEETKVEAASTPGAV